jgi:hypothetical protein
MVDWKKNPGGLFYKLSGTDWDVTLSTAWSWFVPTFTLFFLVWTAGLFLLRWARTGEKGASG